MQCADSSTFGCDLRDQFEVDDGIIDSAIRDGTRRQDGSALDCSCDDSRQLQAESLIEVV